MTVIQNAKSKGEPEKELPEGTVIGFEIGDIRLSCPATENGLKIYKKSDKGAEESRIITVGEASNVLYIR